MDNFFHFVEKHIQKSTKSIDFRSVARTHGSNLHSCLAHEIPQLRLVVDVEQCLVRLYGGFKVNWTTGGHWIYFQQFHESLIELCIKNNIQLIYYLNGTTPKGGYATTWFEKQAELTEKIDRINEILESKKDKACVPQELWTPPTNLKQALINTVKLNKQNIDNNQVFVFASLRNHAKEIVQFCKLNTCHGIMTNDMEVLAYLCSHNMASKTKLYSARSFTVGKVNERFTAYEYDVQEIFQYFQVEESEFVKMTALLARNQWDYDRVWFGRVFEKIDRIYFDKLGEAEKENFERLHPNFKKISLLAPFIKSHGLNNIDDLCEFLFDIHTTGYAAQKEKMRRCVNLFENTDPIGYIPNLDNEINKALQHRQSCTEQSVYGNRRSNSSTYTAKKNRDYERQSEFKYKNILVKSEHRCEDSSKSSAVRVVIGNFEYNHVRCNVSFLKYQAYVDKQIYLPVCLEPIALRVENLNEFYKPIRKRAYALIYGAHLNRNESIYIEEIQFDALSGNRAVDKIQVLALDLIPSRFSLEKIWCKTCTDTKKRFNLLIESLNIKDAMEVLSFDNIRETLLGPLLVLRYMLKNINRITRQEIYAFLATFNSDRLFNKSYIDDRLKFDLPNERAVYLASMFMRGIEHLDFLNDTCGAPLPAQSLYPYNFFNGILFQYYFLKSQHGIDIKQIVSGDSLNLAEQMDLINLQYDFVVQSLESLVMENQPSTIPFRKPTTAPVFKPLGRGIFAMNTQQNPICMQRFSGFRGYMDDMNDEDLARPATTCTSSNEVNSNEASSKKNYYKSRRHNRRKPRSPSAAAARQRQFESITQKYDDRDDNNNYYENSSEKTHTVTDQEVRDYLDWYYEINYNITADYVPPRLPLRYPALKPITVEEIMKMMRANLQRRPEELVIELAASEEERDARLERQMIEVSERTRKAREREREQAKLLEKA